MANITIALPDALKRKLDTMPEMNWSAVAREAIIEQADAYMKFKEAQARARANLKEKDLKKLATKVNLAVYKRYKTMQDEYGASPLSSTRTSSSRRLSAKRSPT